MKRSFLFILISSLFFSILCISCSSSTPQQDATRHEKAESIRKKKKQEEVAAKNQRDLNKLKRELNKKK